MNYIILLLLFPALLSAGSTENRAAQHLQKAAFKYQEVKDTTKYMEHRILKTTDIEKDNLKYLIPVVFLAQGKVDSGSAIPWRIQTNNGIVMPNLKYDMNSGRSSIILLYQIDF